MAKVTELGYLGIGVSDAAAWKEYATQVVGMELLDEGEADRFYLRMDNWHHRIVVHTSGEDDVAAAFKFYTSVLGMRGSIEYKLPVPGGMIAKPVFLHCNSRDHSIAFGVGPMTKRINHLMIELATIDDLGMTYDIVRSRNIPVAISLGKHSNDQAFTFYSANPSGWLWEIGWGAR